AADQIARLDAELLSGLVHRHHERHLAVGVAERRRTSNMERISWPTPPSSSPSPGPTAPV
ncbi:hypothetical protein AB0346_29695, partial [Nocardia beijingensis]|uniref:hypothetical protein n=1 Tax=Nocardia beijingensis TaxID=95162 RepID=UPI00344BAC53